MIDLMTRHDSLQLAEIGAILLALAGAWMFITGLPFLKLVPMRSLGAGILLAAGGVCLLIALREGLIVVPKS